MNIKYLIKKNLFLRTIINVCLNNSRFLRRLNFLYNERNRIENIIDILLVLMKIRKTVHVRFKNGFVFYNFKEVYWKYLKYYIKAFENNIRIQNRGKKVIALIKNLKLQLLDNINGIYQINEIFLQESYKNFEYKDKTIIDIGGFIGDTAFFFLLKGSKKITVYEINKEAFKVLEENVISNKLEKKIIIYNKGISNKYESNILNITEKRGSSSLHMNLNKNVQIVKRINVELIPIKKVLENSIDILKIDCEGCEYAILESMLENNLINKIREGIVLETHTIDVKRNPIYAISLLENIGFKKIEVNKRTELNWMIYAKKNEY